MPKDIQFVDAREAAPRENSSEREEIYAARERAEEIVKGETPRAVVLIYTAAIEQALQEAIRGFLVPSNQKDDSLLETIANSFENRIDLAYRLGMISHGMWRDLHIFRDLRDDCLARIEAFSFDHTPIQSSVASLVRNVGKQAFAGLPIGRMDTEARYAFLARLFLVHLQNFKNSTKRLPETGRERLYAES